MRYRKNAQLLASDVAYLLRERGIPVIPQAIDVGDVDAEAVRLGDSVELAELGDGTFMVSVNRGGGNWGLEEVVFDLEEAADVAAACYGRGSRMEANASKRCWGELQRGVYVTPRGKRIVVASKANKFRFYYEDTEQQVGPEVYYLRGVMEYAAEHGWEREEDHNQRRLNEAREREPAPPRIGYTAANIMTAARRVPDGERYLRGSKVWISDLMSLLPGLTKTQLLSMHRRGDIELNRADLVQAVPEWQRHKIEDSLIEDGFAEDNLVVVDMVPNAGALKTRTVGNCPVCEGDFRLNKDRMVHHGYKRPGWGMIVGDCFGVGHLAYELSAEGCEAYLQACEGSLPGLIEHLEKLERGEIEELTVERWVHSRQKTEYVTVRAKSESASERLEFGDALRRNIRLMKKNIDQVKSEITRMERRIAAWTAKPVRTFEEYEAAQRTAPERLKAQAEREAKRTAKEEKARLLDEKKQRWEAEKQALIEKYRHIFSMEYLTRETAREFWSEMHRSMDKKSYLYFRPKELDMDERLRELGLARNDPGYALHYAYPDGSLR